jgi:hypothetical protein
LAGGVSPEPFVAEIVADAILDRRDLDRAQILDEAGVRGLAIERLEASAQPKSHQQSGGDARAVRPRH